VNLYRDDNRFSFVCYMLCVWWAIQGLISSDPFIFAMTVYIAIPILVALAVYELLGKVGLR